MRAADPWTRERIAKLKKLWAAGATAQSIASLLGGVSRAAVLGKVFRLRGEAETAAPAAPPANQIPRESDAKQTGAAAPVRRRRSSKRDDPSEGQATDRRRGKSLLELTNESCRWPHGNPGTARFHFCGAPGADLDGGMPYCPLHAQRAYRKRQAKSESNSESKPESQRESPQPSSTRASQQTDTLARRRRYVWRASVRHPAPRWK